MNADENSGLHALIEEHFNGTLSPERRAMLESWLRSSAGARKAFWDLAEIHGLIREVEKTSGSSEHAETVVFPAKSAPRFQHSTRLAIAAAITLLATVSSLVWWSQTSPRGTVSGYVAEVRSSDKAVWAKSSGSPAAGEALQTGAYELLTGNIELGFFNGATVAVRGPAKLRLLAADRMALDTGTLSADVPERAIGFTVETPVSEVRDLGTRFGVAVKNDGLTETHVFEGMVDVTPSSKIEKSGNTRRLLASDGLTVDPQSRKVSSRAAVQSEFPLPLRTEVHILPSAGFEPDEAACGINTGCPPESFDMWGGDHSAHVSAERGIVPRSGSGMLHYLGAMRDTTPPEDAGVDSERFCWVDLKPYQQKWKGRSVVADFSAWFNRVAVPGDGTCNAKVIITAYGPGASPGLAAWQHRMQFGTPMGSLANSEVELMTDENPRTWQYALARLAIPPGATMLLVSTRAESDEGKPPLRFEDIYADDMELSFEVGEALLDTP